VNENTVLTYATWASWLLWIIAIGTVAVSGGAVYVWLHKATD
jgi:hypothetical protein